MSWYTYIPSHLVEWMRKPMRPITVDDVTLEHAILYNHRRLVKYLLGQGVLSEYTTILKNPSKLLSVNHQSASTITKDGYGLFGYRSRDEPTYYEARDFSMKPYRKTRDEEIPPDRALEQPRGCIDIMMPTYVRRFKVAVIAPQMVARYSWDINMIRIIVNHVGETWRWVWVGAVASGLFYRNTVVLKYIESALGIGVPPELLGYCHDADMLAWYLDRTPNLDNDYISDIGDVITFRDNLELAETLIAHVKPESREKAHVNIALGAAENNALKLSQHYITPGPLLHECISAALLEPGACIDWLWEKYGGTPDFPTLGQLCRDCINEEKLRGVIWCVSHGASRSQYDQDGLSAVFGFMPQYDDVDELSQILAELHRLNPDEW